MRRRGEREQEEEWEQRSHAPHDPGSVAPMRRCALLLCVTGLALAASTAQACACGIALDATVSRERALVIDGGDSEQIVLSLDLQSDTAGRSAIVLPVPADPEVEAIGGGDPLAYLDVATAPVAAAGGGDKGVGAASGPGAGVDVIGRDEIGGYDVSRLRADDAGALDAWLDDNGYTLPTAPSRSCATTSTRAGATSPSSWRPAAAAR